MTLYISIDKDVTDKIKELFFKSQALKELIIDSKESDVNKLVMEILIDSYTNIEFKLSELKSDLELKVLKKYYRGFEYSYNINFGLYRYELTTDDKNVIKYLYDNGFTLL